MIDRLLVGAPLSNVTSSFGGETLEKYGTVFKCEYKPNSKSCTEIAVDHRRKSICSKLVFVYLSRWYEILFFCRNFAMVQVSETSFMEVFVHDFPYLPWRSWALVSQFAFTVNNIIYSSSIREIFIAAPNKEQHQLGNETITVEIEKKTEQWLGATLQSTGENGNVLVSFSITSLNMIIGV